MAWSPSQYVKFEDERTRPARDLLTQVPLDTVTCGIDLGCGPGNSTELLVRRFPQAQVTGTDNSEAMLVSARERLPQARFELGDIATWAPASAGDAPDLIYANAALQWVPDHEALIPRLFAALAPGGDARVSAMLFFGMINWTHTWFDPAGPVMPEMLALRVVDLMLRGVQAS